MSHKPAVVVMAVLVVLLGIFCVRQWSEISSLKESSIVPPHADVSIECGWHTQDEIAWSLAGQKLDRVYILFLGWFRPVQTETPIMGQRQVVVMRLCRDTSVRGERGNHIGSIPVHLRRSCDPKPGKGVEIAYMVNGIRVFSFSDEEPEEPKPGFGTSWRPVVDTLTVDRPSPNEGSASRLTSALDVFEKRAFKWELLVCNREFLRPFVDKGELKYYVVGGNNGGAVIAPIREVFPEEKPTEHTIGSDGEGHPARP